MLRIRSKKDADFIELPLTSMESLGIFSADNEFEFEDLTETDENETDSNSDKESKGRELRVDFAEQADLEIILLALNRLDTLKERAESILESDLQQFLRILSICNYLQFEAFTKELKSAFFGRINKIATEGEQIADYFKVVERVENLRSFLKVGGKKEEEKAAGEELGGVGLSEERMGDGLTENQKKEIVVDSRYINGQSYPQVLKFEEFYCREKVDKSQVYTHDIRSELDYDL